MLADYLQRDAERTSGLEDTDEAQTPDDLSDVSLCSRVSLHVQHRSAVQALSDLPSSPVDKGKKAKC